MLELIQGVQSSLKGYIISMLANKSDAEDILQETNRYLVENQQQFEIGTNFKAWAFRVAFFRVKSHIRDQQRKGLVTLDNQLIEKLAEQGATYFSESDQKVEKLVKCMKQLKGNERELIKKHYFEKKTMTLIASQIGKPVNTIHQSVSRIRRKLKNCIDKKS